MYSPTKEAIKMIRIKKYKEPSKAMLDRIAKNIGVG